MYELLVVQSFFDEREKTNRMVGDVFQVDDNRAQEIIEKLPEYVEPNKLAARKTQTKKV